MHNAPLNWVVVGNLPLPMALWELWHKVSGKQRPENSVHLGKKWRAVKLCNTFSLHISQQERSRGIHCLRWICSLAGVDNPWDVLGFCLVLVPAEATRTTLDPPGRGKLKRKDRIWGINSTPIHGHVQPWHSLEVCVTKPHLCHTLCHWDLNFHPWPQPEAWSASPASRLQFVTLHQTKAELLSPLLERQVLKYLPQNVDFQFWLFDLLFFCCFFLPLYSFWSI